MLMVVSCNVVLSLVTKTRSPFTLVMVIWKLPADTTEPAGEKLPLALKRLLTTWVCNLPAMADSMLAVNFSKAVEGVGSAALGAVKALLLLAIDSRPAALPGLPPNKGFTGT